MAAFHYARGLASLRRLDRPEFPPIDGFWLDEMDKLPVAFTVDLIEECRAAYAKEGKSIPLQMINLCDGRSPRSVTFYELADAACSAYGFHGGSLGDGFGRLSALPAREYRRSRRTFLPYFRDCEMPVLIDPETKAVIGRDPSHQRCIEPKEERWMTYGCIIQGAKGIMHWNYGARISKPPNWFSKDKWMIRASMGGALGHKPHGYEIPADVAAQLEATWDEIGRINTELRAIGPLVATSDVSSLVRASSDQVEAAALVSGLDAIVLVVLTHGMKTHWKGDRAKGIESYEPVDTSVELRVPAWLDPKHVFRVRHDRVEAISPRREAGRLFFRFERLEVSDVVVVTERDGLMESMAATVKELCDRR